MSVQLATIADFDAYMERKGGTAKRVCRWKWNESDGSYDTSCGEKYCIIDGTPSDNKMIYCHFCSKKIKEV